MYPNSTNCYMKQLVFLICLPALLLPACKKNNSPSEPVNIGKRVLTQNLDHPWEILWGPDQFLWITERSGKISRVNPSTGAVTPVLTIADVTAVSEGGLLGMALHPDFNTTPHVFVAYNYETAGIYREKIVRYIYNGTTLTNPVIILDNIAAFSWHNGCRLLISPDKKLLITTGDAYNTSLPQNSASVNGKILRLNLDGSIPADNPSGTAIWTLGHRNPQGLVYGGNILFSSEHGPDSDDEINIIEKGRNYGWPNVKGICNTNEEKTFCNANNVTEPIQAWTPTVAVSGMEYYEKDLIPQWKHSLLVATLKGTRLIQLQLNGQHTGVEAVHEFFVNEYGRLRDVCVAPDGKVYICTDNGGNDKIIEINKE